MLLKTVIAAAFATSIAICTANAANSASRGLNNALGHSHNRKSEYCGSGIPKGFSECEAGHATGGGYGYPGYAYGYGYPCYGYRYGCPGYEYAYPRYRYYGFGYPWYGYRHYYGYRGYAYRHYRHYGHVRMYRHRY